MSLSLQEAVARVLTAHHPNRAVLGACYCGKEWHPLHQAQELARAGLLTKSVPMAATPSEMVPMASQDPLENPESVLTRDTTKEEGPHA